MLVIANGCADYGIGYKRRYPKTLRYGPRRLVEQGQGWVVC